LIDSDHRLENPKKMMIKNILVICHSNIGDFCCDLVVINPLRKQFPDSRISVLTSSRAKPFAQGYQGLDSIITFDKHAKDKGLAARIRMVIALRKERYELVIILNSTLMYKFLNTPRTWSLRTYLRRLPSEIGKHVIDTYLEFLESYGIDAPEARFNFVSSKEEEGFRDKFLAKAGISAQEKVVGILPLAGWSLKSWPMDKWNDLAKALKKEYGIKVIAFGDSDDAYFKQIVVPHTTPEIILTGKTTLWQALTLIKRCDVFIAPDTGLLHLASIMGVKAVGLYGPSPKNYIYPYFHRDLIVLPRERLACMPCYPHLKACVCKEEDLLFGRCMERICVDDVLGVLRQTLGLKKP
jgi:ADP-heptose:LPS heptosyltransferase